MSTECVSFFLEVFDEIRTHIRKTPRGWHNSLSLRKIIMVWRQLRLITNLLYNDIWVDCLWTFGCQGISRAILSTNGTWQMPRVSFKWLIILLMAIGTSNFKDDPYTVTKVIRFILRRNIFIMWLIKMFKGDLLRTNHD